MTILTTVNLPMFVIQDILSYLGRDIYQDKNGDWYFRFTPGLYDDALGWMFQSITTVVKKILRYIPSDLIDSGWSLNVIRKYTKCIYRRRCCITVIYYTGNHIEESCTVYFYTDTLLINEFLTRTGTGIGEYISTS